jgi:hypothetical protein
MTDFEHAPEADPEELALEELELEDEELEVLLPSDGPEAEYLRRAEEHEVVPLDDDDLDL